MRVLGIGDAHDSPRLANKDRFYWIGRYIKEHRIRKVIQIGDFLTFDSLCKYDPNETLLGKLKPAFIEDIRSGAEALFAFREGLDKYPCSRIVTLGNHEDRVYSFENRTPEIESMMSHELLKLFHDYGWKTIPYGEIHFESGVGFVHTALNTLGRAYGGKTALQRIAADSTFDIVIGHDHKGGVFRCPKIGNNNVITAYNLGCALPDGHIEDYVGHAMSGWQYGIHEIYIDQGKINSWKYISMRELENAYG